MKWISGGCVISVPKSGTMFLTRSLERLHRKSCTFGLFPEEEISRVRCKDFQINSSVSEILSPHSPSVEKVMRRYKQMMARNRSKERDSSSRLFSDHGLKSFPRFLFAPSRQELRHPASIVEAAASKSLNTVFLYRDIRSVAASLTHFLCLGKSYLIRTDNVKRTGDVVSKLHAPILSDMIVQWIEEADKQEIMLVKYEKLIDKPYHYLSAISEHCGFGKIDFQDDAELIGFRPWTYQNRSGAWYDGLSDEARARLEYLSADAATRIPV